MNMELTSDYYLERYALGELPEEDASEIQKLASAYPAIRSKLNGLEFSNREILALYPPATVKASLLSEFEKSKSASKEGWSAKVFPLRRLIYLSTAVVTLALLLILILPGRREPSGLIPFLTESDLSVVKGIPEIDLSKTQLIVFRKKGDEVEILHDKNQARAGDLLQLAYVTVEKQNGMILSIDGRGAVSLHFPAGLEESTNLRLNEKALLPNAIELDDAPDFERFFFITSNSSLDVGSILRKAEILAKTPGKATMVDLDLPENLQQYSILILKGEGQ